MTYLFICFFFFFNATAPTEIYTLSLHDALPISARCHVDGNGPGLEAAGRPDRAAGTGRGRKRDRKSTRLNSSHVSISYAVFCLKKKKRPSRWSTKASADTSMRRARAVVARRSCW